jgi:hypothetical protein
MLGFEIGARLLLLLDEIVRAQLQRLIRELHLLQMQFKQRCETIQDELKKRNYPLAAFRTGFDLGSTGPQGGNLPGPAAGMVQLEGVEVGQEILHEGAGDADGGEVAVRGPIDRLAHNFAAVEEINSQRFAGSQERKFEKITGKRMEIQKKRT